MTVGEFGIAPRRIQGQKPVDIRLSVHLTLLHDDSLSFTSLLKLYRRFEWLVSFDNNILGELNDQLSFSYTLAVKHKAYSPKGYTRVFMVEVEDCASPNVALQWLLDELVEDGDLIVCVHIARHVFNLTADEHKQEARILLETIMAKVDEDRAISIILEFAGGRITHADFQSMVNNSFSLLIPVCL